MKRISKSLLLVLLAVSVPLMMASGQEKKSEKKVKIVTIDKDGSETIIDTTFTGESTPDSIAFKNGKVIYFDTPGSVTARIKTEEGKGNIYVTSIADDDDGTETVDKEVIVMSGDNGEWTITRPAGNKQHVYIQSGTDGKNEKTEKHVIVKSTGSNDAVWEDNDGKTFHVTVSSDTESDNGMTKYIIAKDGVVVTVESDDEDKAREIIKEIENKMDVKSDAVGKKEAPKAPAKPEKK
jgi:hypothetical protein